MSPVFFGIITPLMFRVAHFDCMGHSVAFSDYLLL